MLFIILLTSNINLKRTLVIFCEFITGSITYIIVLTLLKDDSIEFVFDKVKDIFSRKRKTISEK